MKATNEMLKAAAKEDAKRFANLPLTEGQIEWLKGKDFDEKFLKKINHGLFAKRVECINEGRDRMFDLLSKVPGCTGGEDQYGSKFIICNDKKYWFGKSSEETEDKESLYDLVNAINNDGVSAEYEEYLSNFWPKKKTFMNIFGVQATAAVDNMTYEESIEFDRFNTTMKEYRRRQQQMQEDNKLLYSILRDMTKEQAWAEAMGQQPVDEIDRSREAEAMKKVAENMTEEDKLDLLISRKVVGILRNVDPNGDFNDLYWDDRTRREPHIMSVEEVRTYILSVKGETYKSVDKDGNEVTKKLGDFNLFMRFNDLVEDKYIDVPTLVYITGSTKFSYGNFLDFKKDPDKWIEMRKKEEQ